MPKPEAFLPLKTNWFHILLSLAGEDQHGYGIMQEVLERTGGKVRLWPATLYGSLKRLIEAGLIEESGALRMYRRLALAFPHEFQMVYGADVIQLGEEAIDDIWTQHGFFGLLRL